MISFINKIFRYDKTENIKEVSDGVNQFVFDTTKKQLMLDLNGERNLIGGEIYEENQEIIIGRVGDKPLYRKMIVITDISPFDGTGIESITIPHNIENIDSVISYRAYFTRTESDAYKDQYQLPYIDDAHVIATHMASVGSENFYFYNKTGMSWANTDTLSVKLVVIVEYTKKVVSATPEPEVTE